MVKVKSEMSDYIDSISPALNTISDKIFDKPELGFHEYYASKLICDAFSKEGFRTELGVGKLDTSFKAVYENGTWGPSIGLLCEYDALEGLGHGCGHQMQGPAILGCALAVKKYVKDKPYKLIVYGTPAEEGGAGKSIMLNNGCFRDIEVALMMHGSPTTTTDIKSMALTSFLVTYHGKSAHAALKPEDGRSAFDAMLLAFHGIELMREHVLEDTRMHYTVLNAGGSENIVPENAVGRFQLRSYSTQYLQHVIKRFKDIIYGSAMMSGVTCEIEELSSCKAKVPVIKLNNLLMNNAEIIHAPQIGPSRKKTGSTDFAEVMSIIPGSCIRVAFVPVGTSAHSQDYVNAGKTEAAHKAIAYGAKILAFTVMDMIEDPQLINEFWEEFKKNRSSDLEI